MRRGAGGGGMVFGKMQLWKVVALWQVLDPKSAGPGAMKVVNGVLKVQPVTPCSHNKANTRHSAKLAS